MQHKSANGRDIRNLVLSSGEV